MFHATLQYEFQLCDEIPMMFSVLTASLFIWYRKYRFAEKENPSSRWRVGLLALYAGALAFMLPTEKDWLPHAIVHTVFVVVFAVQFSYMFFALLNAGNEADRMANELKVDFGAVQCPSYVRKCVRLARGCLARTLKSLADRAERNENRLARKLFSLVLLTDEKHEPVQIGHYFDHCFGWFSFAFIAWIIDNRFCFALQNLPISMPYVNLHALGWHFGCMCGIHYTMLIAMAHYHTHHVPGLKQIKEVPCRYLCFTVPMLEFIVDNDASASSVGSKLKSS
jgi:hypothetical protein